VASPVPVICLAGPTASGKTDLAVGLVERFPFDIVSVDSALVYRGMDIGTAKPDASLRARAPHRLVDIREPEEAYSAGEFTRDAGREISAIHQDGRIPLLVGGTMLYFRALTDGIARLPGADKETRAAIDAEASERGWAAMHDELARVDPVAAARIEPNDRQRIQRALEVWRLSGRPLSAWQDAGKPAGRSHDFLRIALIDGDRARLQRRINRRFDAMLEAGFLDEVRRLRARPGLHADNPSMRSVGYRQLWAHLAGDWDLDTAVARGKAATRQLAKRQLTWLRADRRWAVFDPLEKASAGAISRVVEQKLNL